MHCMNVVALYAVITICVTRVMLKSTVVILSVEIIYTMRMILTLYIFLLFKNVSLWHATPHNEKYIFIFVVHFFFRFRFSDSHIFDAQILESWISIIFSYL